MRGWIELDLTPLVKEWHFGTHPNYGLFVQGDETPSLARQRFFYSLNAQNGLYPRLVVDYTASTDNTPPVATVQPFDPPKTSGDSFVVSWQVVELEPALNIQHYDLRYRFNNEPWQPWLTGTQLTSATFTSLRAQDGVYAFEVRALNSANRLEEFKGVAEATILVDRYAPFLEPRAWLPVVFW